MSREREILKKILMLYREDKSCMDWGTANEIQELLAQPEPLTPRQGLEEYKRGYARAELDLKREPLSDTEITKNTPKLIHIGERLAFHAGVRFSERHHIIGVNDDT